MLKLSILVRVFLCFLVLLLPLSEMDEWFYDHYFSIRGRQDLPTPIVLIEVDAAKLPRSQPKVNWPLLWERAQHPATSAPYPADTYQALLAKLLKANPKQIVFTSYYASGAPLSLQAPQEKVVYSALINEEFQVTPPPKGLTEGENYGFNALFPDDDNTIRRTHLGTRQKPSLALRLSYRLRPETSIEEGTEDELFWIDFRGPAGSFPKYAAHEILETGADLSALENRILLVGPASRSSRKFETPVGPLTRLQVQASILDTVLENRRIVHLPRWVNMLVGGLAIMLSVWVILGFPIYSAWMSLLLLALVILVSTLFLFAYSKVWIGVANPIVCVFVTHFFMMGYKLGRQEEQQTRIQQESDKLKEMDEFKNNFISLFSHDLKTPIAKIKAITERLLAENPSLDPKVIESLQTIGVTNQELARFISDILKVTRMETMSIQLKREVIDLNRLVEEAVGRSRFMADEKKVELVMDLEPLFSMEGDQQLIEEVIANLLENAIKYSPSGKQVVVSTQESNGQVRVAVKDQGEGIPEQEIPKVTTKFYRGKSAAEQTKGSGLGLYLANYFVALHHGRLEIESKLEKGTTVSFWLPIPS